MKYSYNEFVEYVKIGHEIEFTYKGIIYFETHNGREVILLKTDDNIKQIFRNQDEFLSKVRIDSKRIEEIWNDIIIESIY